MSDQTSTNPNSVSNNWADQGKSPKWILSIDGGGFRGVMAAQSLVELEYLMIRKSNNNSELKLAQLFDLIAGTSTGSIIAAGLACGMSANEILKFYMKEGKMIFKKKNIPFFRIYKYPSKVLENVLEKVFGEKGNSKREIDFDDLSNDLWMFKIFRILRRNISAHESNEEKQKKFFKKGDLKTGLMITSRNATKGLPFYFFNHEKSNCFEAYKNVTVGNLVRASCAAPGFFSPHLIYNEKDKVEEKFIDGGIGIYNNPAYRAFIHATDTMGSDEDFGLGWKTGVNELLIISIGTCYRIVKPKDEKVFENNFRFLELFDVVVNSLMSDAQFEQVKLMERIGFSPYLSSEASLKNETDNAHKHNEGRIFTSLKNEEKDTIEDKMFCYIRLNENSDEVTIENLLLKCFGNSSRPNSNLMDSVAADEFFNVNEGENSLLKILAKKYSANTPKVEVDEYIIDINKRLKDADSSFSEVDLVRLFHARLLKCFGDSSRPHSTSIDAAAANDFFNANQKKSPSSNLDKNSSKVDVYDYIIERLKNSDSLSLLKNSDLRSLLKNSDLRSLSRNSELNSLSEALKEIPRVLLLELFGTGSKSGQNFIDAVAANDFFDANKVGVNVYIRERLKNPNFRFLRNNQKQPIHSLKDMDCVDNGDILRLIGAAILKERSINDEAGFDSDRMLKVLESYNLTENKINRKNEEY